MSSVVISGDTSGAITLAAPAVAGTTTLTLPATTGSVIGSNSSGDIQFNSGYGSVAKAYGVRAWVNFNGTTSPGTIRGSGNVTSITKNGTGSFTLNFTTAMPDANYNWNFGGDGSGARGITFGVAETNVAAPTSSAFRMKFYDDTAAIIDPTYACVSIHR